MIKVIQFGEGNFLRTFVDAYFDALNKETNQKYVVSIIKPIPFGNLDSFKKQKNRYHIVLRGVSDGKAVEDVYEIDSVKECIDPFADEASFYALAKDPEVKLLVSNTTEAGIVFNPNDKEGGFAEISYPAKLTKWLFARFKAGLDGLYLLPVELIDHNADELFRDVNAYIDLWGLGEDFKKWNAQENYYCNTLVDRIVSGFPRNEETKNHLWKLLDEEDNLLSVGEPFGLWAIEKKGRIVDYIREGHHNIDVVLTEDISYYKKRKVRVLNGSHTNMVPMALWYGKKTVADVMEDESLCYFVKETLEKEIVPFVSEDQKATKEFAKAVLERFKNPYLNHQLTSIALNCVSKWKARCLPSFLDYCEAKKQLPSLLTIGFAYLVILYKHIEEKGDAFFAHLPNREIVMKDEERYLKYFSNGHDVRDFLSDVSIWGQDLSDIPGFYDEVMRLIDSIERGEEVLR